MIYGLGAALGWGVADLGAALVSRRIGSLATVAIVQAAGLVSIWGVVLASRVEWTWSTGVLLLLVGNGGLVAAAYAMHYRALELGPVALVGPITASYAVFPIALAAVLLAEPLSAGLLATATVTVVGVALATFDPRRLGAGQDTRAGIPFALASAVLFGVGSFVLARAAQEMGALPSVAIGRVCTCAFLVPAVLVRRPRLRDVDARSLALGVVVGFFDVAGIVAYTRGAEVVGISLVTAVSATFPLIPVAGGMSLFGERPAPTQLLGALLVVSGLVGLGAVA